MDNLVGPYLSGYDGFEAFQTSIKYPNLVNMSNLLQRIVDFSSSHKIDDIMNLNGSRVYIIGGSKDIVVNQGSLRLASTVYSIFGANVLTQFSIPAGHGIVSNFQNYMKQTNKATYIN